MRPVKNLTAWVPPRAMSPLPPHRFFAKLTPNFCNLINPTLERVHSEIKYILDNVQKNSKSKIINKVDVSEVMVKTQGVFQFNGKRRPQDYSTGLVTRLGLVWTIDRTGAKHIRIQSDRVHANILAIPSIFDSTPSIFDKEHIFYKVYKHLKPFNCCRCKKVIDIEQGCWWVENLNFYCFFCNEYDKYYKETGFLLSRR